MEMLSLFIILVVPSNKYEPPPSPVYDHLPPPVRQIHVVLTTRDVIVPGFPVSETVAALWVGHGPVEVVPRLGKGKQQ